MFGLKLNNATRGSLNTCTSYPPCSSPFPKVKVISGLIIYNQYFFGSQPPRHFTILLFLLFPSYSIINLLQTQIGQQRLTSGLNVIVILILKLQLIVPIIPLSIDERMH